MSLALPASLRRSLAALDYPELKEEGELRLTDEELKKLILWLEESKIRLLPSRERAGLREIKPQHHEEWLKSFGAYLRALGVIPNPVPGTGASSALGQWHAVNYRLSVVQKLISFAVEDVYLDLKEAGQIAVSPTASTAAAAEPIALSDCVNQVNALLLKFNLPPLSKKPTELTLQKMASAIEAVEANVAPPECNQTHQPNLKMAIGFNVEGADPQLKDFCAVLRLVHVAEIRNLQQHINATLAALQEVTGDPKTDTKQGRVGGRHNI